VPDVLLQAHSASLQMTFLSRQGIGAISFPGGVSGRGLRRAARFVENRTGRTGSQGDSRAVKDGVATGEYEDFLTGFVIDDARSGAAPSASRLRMRRPARDG